MLPVSFNASVRCIRHPTTCWWLAMSAGCISSVCVAADAPETRGDRTHRLEEIVVTAQRREERLQDVPISISVLGGVELDRAVGRGLNDELSRVPGVAITEAAQTGGSNITIRGVGAPYIVAFGSSPIAYYLDSVPFGFVRTALTPDVVAYDLDRVEVLRGPQGTLYGASAQNGVVRVLTKDADLGAAEFKMKGQTSSTQYGGTNYGADAAANLPIVQDKLAARVVLGYQDWSGWIDRPVRKDANDAELRNARLKIKAQPTEALSVGLSAWLSRGDFGALSVGDDDRKRRAIGDESIDTAYDAFSLKLGYEFEPFSLTSSTSYIDYRVDSTLDLAYDGEFMLATDLTERLLAEEINLHSKSKGPWSWSLGAMYREATDGAFQAGRDSSGALTRFFRAPTKGEESSESVAVFGELTRSFFDRRLELTGGLRYFQDRVTAREISNALFVGGVPPEGLRSTQIKFHKTSPRAVLTWHATENITSYMSYSEGFRSGFRNGSRLVDLPPADPDNLINYEIGAKGDVLDGKLSFDAAVYYMDWQDVQTPFLIAALGTVFAATTNGESASGAGFDLGLTGRPTDDLTLSLSFSMNDLTQDEDVLSNGALLFNKGERLNVSPKYTAGGSVDYSFPLSRSGFQGKLSLAANYVSERTRRLFSITSVSASSEPLLLGRAGFSIESPRDWTATLYVDNATNEQDAVVAQSASGLPDDNPRLRPRTIGLQVDYRFGW